MPCKRSSAAPIPFVFQLSVALSRRTALPALARSAPCGFVPLRQSRRNLKVSILYKLDKSSGWLLSHNFKSPSFRLKCERKLKFLPYREWNCSYCFRDFKSCSIPSVDLDSSLNAAVIRCEIKVSIARTKGFGLLTGAPGRGKTTLVRSWSTGLNPSLYKVIYTSLSTITVNDFTGISPHPWVHSHPTGRPKTFTSFRRRSTALPWIKRRLRLSSLMKRTISKMLFLMT